MEILHSTCDRTETHYHPCYRNTVVSPKEVASPISSILYEVQKYPYLLWHLEKEGEA